MRQIAGPTFYLLGPGLVSISPDSSSNNIITTEMKDCSNWTPITEDKSNITGLVELFPASREPLTTAQSELLALGVPPNTGG